MAPSPGPDELLERALRQLNTARGLRDAGDRRGPDLEGSILYLDAYALASASASVLDALSAQNALLRDAESLRAELHDNLAELLSSGQTPTPPKRLL